jgi:hypothetical protein
VPPTLQRIAAHRAHDRESATSDSQPAADSRQSQSLGVPRRQVHALPSARRWASHAIVAVDATQPCSRSSRHCGCCTASIRARSNTAAFVLPPELLADG